MYMHGGSESASRTATPFNNKAQRRVAHAGLRGRYRKNPNGGMITLAFIRQYLKYDLV